MTFYEGQAPGGTHQLLALLEANKLLLCLDDQGFVDGCRLTLDEGGVLTPANQQQLKRIASTANSGAPNMAGIATEEPSLSVIQMLRKLASTVHTLSQEEKRFANLMAKKYNAKKPMTAEEFQKLSTLYTLKGF